MEEKVDTLEKRITVLESIIVNKLDIDIKKYQTYLKHCEECKAQGNKELFNCNTCDYREYFESILC